MVFSSLIFTFLFLPVVIFLYYIANDKYKNIILLIASLIFYAYGEHRAILLMLISILVNYAFALLIERHPKKSLLAIDITFNLSMLYMFKYLTFTVSLLNNIPGINIPVKNIALPIGISFFTFQAMSYVIDVYRRDAVAERSVLNVALYISFFPQLVAGPIVRYNTIAEQIHNRTCDIDKFGAGAKRFVCGFSKKIILANNLALVAEKALLQGDFYTQPILLSWVGAICFTLQIYYDFSGYSDMAIGLGKMFGFEFEENFNYPYISRSVTEFWRRWHISLGRWFRDYVYIPLGGSKVTILRHIFNLLVVWCLTGLWHGASISFVIWGLMYFVCLVVEKFWIKPEKRESKIFKAAWYILTMLIVIFGWVLFDTESVRQSVRCYKSMFGMYGNAWCDGANWSYLKQYIAYMTMGIVFALPIAPKLSNIIYKHEKIASIINVILPLGYMLVFLWAVSFLILGAHNPFIYFNF